MNLNKVFIIGRLTADPQLRTTPSGQSVTSLSVATNRYWTDKNGGRREDTEFHNVVVWGRQAEVASQFLTKGSSVFIEGRLQTRSWQDSQGQARKVTEIICERLQLGAKPQGGSRFSKQEEISQSQESKIEEVPTIDIEESGGEIKPEEIPF